MKTHTKWTIGVIIAVLIIIGFSLGNNNEPTNNNEIIKIGFIGPLTGAFPDWGEAIQRGVLLALEDTKHTFDVDFQDSACEPRRVVDIGKKFFEIDGINIVIGPGCLGGLKPLMPIAIENNAILFSTGFLDQDVLETYDSNLINFATQISMEAQFLSSYWNSQNIKDVAILHGTDSFGLEFKNQLSNYLSNLDIDLAISEGVPFDTTDLRTQALKFIEANPELIMLNIGEKEMGLFAKQVRELGFEGKLYAIYTAESESMLNAGGSALENLKYSFPVNSSDNSPEKLAFEERYRERFGENAIPNANSFFVYDGILLLDQALDVCAPTDTACIEEFFKNRGDYKGLAGDVSFQENGGSIRPFGIKQIQGNEFSWITKEVELK